jgi:hypothetical protein
MRRLGICFCLGLLLSSPALGGEWKVDDTISALDGSRTYVASLYSQNTIRDAAGSDQQATLLIRCSGRDLESYIAWPQNLGPGPVTMRWKADAGHFTDEIWSVSLDGSATFSESARAFLARLRSAKQAAFQVSLSNFTTLQANFDVTGVDMIVDAAIAACPG